MSQWPSPKLGTVEEVFTARLYWKESKDVSEGGREGDKDLKYCDYSISSHLHHPPIWHTHTHTQHSQLGGNFCHEPEDMVNSPSSPDDAPVCNLSDSTQTILKKVFEDLVSQLFNRCMFNCWSFVCMLKPFPLIPASFSFSSSHSPPHTLLPSPIHQDPQEVVDYHMHLVGHGDSGSGCHLHDSVSLWLTSFCDCW